MINLEFGLVVAIPGTREDVNWSILPDKSLEIVTTFEAEGDLMIELLCEGYWETITRVVSESDDALYPVTLIVRNPFDEE